VQQKRNPAPWPPKEPTSHSTRQPESHDSIESFFVPKRLRAQNAPMPEPGRAAASAPRFPWSRLLRVPRGKTRPQLLHARKSL